MSLSKTGPEAPAVRRGRWATGLVWIASVLAVCVGGGIASLMVLMATSLEPTDLLSSGTEPYTEALIATAESIGLLVVAALALRLWHTARLWPLGLALTAGGVVYALWAGVRFYTDYF